MITLEAFYGELKEVMTYLGVRWGDMHLIKVFIENDQFVLSYKGRQVKIDVNNLKAK